jgi:hypothetical protein
LNQIPVTILSGDRSNLAMTLMVPSTEMQRSVEMLHHEFFQQIDPAVFAECQEPGFQSPQPILTLTERSDSTGGTRQRFRPLTALSQN